MLFPSASHLLDDVAPGSYAFRLKQVDLDGTAEMSPVMEVTVAMKEAYLLSESFPNPFLGERFAETRRVVVAK